MTGKEAYCLTHQLEKVFDVVRIVDPEKMCVMENNEEGNIMASQQTCHAIWGRTQRCASCISAKACSQNKRYEKIEFIEEVMYRVICSPTLIDGKMYSLETISRINGEAVFENMDEVKYEGIKELLQAQLYTDPLTGVLNRRFFEENTEKLHGSAAIAVIDMDDFKNINDVYGHAVGDLALKAVVETIQGHIRGKDMLVRFGGDEFLLAFERMSKETFMTKMETIRNAITEIKIHQVPELELSVSIGCSYREGDKDVSFDDADRQLYVAKMRKNSIAIDNDLVGGEKGQRIIEVYSLFEGEENSGLIPLKEISIIRRQNAIITGLSDSLDYACYISQRDKEAICFQMSDRFKEWLGQIGDELPFHKRMNKFFQLIVHPDDLKRFKEATRAERVLNELNKDKIYIHDFRMKLGGQILYYRIQFIVDKNDPDGIMFGIINIDDKKREEKKRSEEDTLYRIMEMVGNLDDDAMSVYVIDTETGQYMSIDRRTDSRKINITKETKEKRFFDEALAMIDKTVYGPDRERARQYLDLNRIIEEIKNKGAAELEYRIMQGGIPVWCQLRAIYANNESHKTILARVCIIDKLRRIEGETESLDAFVETYTSIYRIDLDNDTIYPHKIGPLMRELLGRMGNKDTRYLMNAKKFITHYVVVEDWERALRIISPTHIKARLSGAKSFTETVRFMAPEGYRYYDVSVTRIGDEEKISECVLGILDSHDRVMKLRASNMIMGDYYSAYIINLKNGRYENIHRNNAYGTDWEMSGDYDEIMEKERPFIHPDDWYILGNIATTEKLKKYVREGNSGELTYRTRGLGFPWEVCAIKVIDTYEGEAEHVLIAFAPAADNRTEELDYQHRHREIDGVLKKCIRLINSGIDADMSIKALMSLVAGHYRAEYAYVSNIDAENGAVKSVVEWHSPNCTNKDELAKNRDVILREDLVRRLLRDGQLHLQRNENRDNEIVIAPFSDKNAVAGFISLVNPQREADDLSLLIYVAAFIQGEQLRKKREEIEESEKNAVISALSDDFGGVTYVTLHTSKYDDYAEDYRTTKEMADEIPNWQEEKRFVKKTDLLFRTVVHPDDKAYFKREASREAILEALKTKRVHFVTFRAILKGEIKNYQLKYVANKDARGNIKGLVVGLHNIDEEINRERENQRILEQTVLERTSEILEKNEALNRLNASIIDLFGEITEARDLDSGEHIKRVKDFTRILATEVMADWPEYNLTKEKIDMISSASALHDVGKIMIPDAILLKPGKLTPEEFEEMKTHCVKGCQIIEKAPADWSAEYINTSLEICRWHHEKYDGKGYPDGLVGDAIPISAQIVSVADCFDALISKRPYKEPYIYEEAVQMIIGGQCGEFSPKLMNSFKKCIDQVINHARNCDQKNNG